MGSGARVPCRRRARHRRGPARPVPPLAQRAGGRGDRKGCYAGIRGRRRPGRPTRVPGSALPRALGADLKTPGTRRGTDRGPRDGSESRPGADPSIQAGAREMGNRSRPTPELMSRLRQGKAELRARRTQMSLKEKVAMVLELQRIYFPLLHSHRALAPWKDPWDTEP